MPVTADPRNQRFLELLDEVDRARGELQRALDDLAAVSAETRRRMAEGMQVSTLHPMAGIGPVRRAVSDRLTGLNSSLMHLRAEAVRLMVDDEGLSLRDVARLIGSSRQFVSRLYHHAADPVRTSPETTDALTDEPA